MGGPMAAWTRACESRRAILARGSSSETADRGIRCYTRDPANTKPPTFGVGRYSRNQSAPPPTRRRAAVFRLAEKHVKGPPGFPFAFCVTTMVGRTSQTVVLAASSKDDLQMWLSAIERSIVEVNAIPPTPIALQGRAP